MAESGHVTQSSSLIGRCPLSRDIAVGEILIVSEPAATLLAPEKLDKLQNHCTHCHLFSKAPIPCEVGKY